MNEPCSPGQPGGYPSDCEILEGYRQRVRDRSKMKNVSFDPVLLERAKHINLLLLDVDGVFTDGTLLYSSSGEEYKPFNTQDGFGLTLLHQAGIKTGIITARQSEMVRRRGEELKMAYVHQGTRKKNDAFKEILKSSGMKPFEVAYMGDDWLDLVLLQQVGLAAAPANGVQEVKDVAHYVTPRPGGQGAVRDLCTLLLTARGEFDRLLGEYSGR